MNPAFDTVKPNIICSTDKSPIEYKIGEPMTFRFSVSYDGKELPEKLFFEWERTGDDGMVQKGSGEVAPEKEVIITTSLDRPGFVRIQGKLKTADGEVLQTSYDGGKTSEPIAFDGGAGAAVASILPAAEEPADFMEYWDRQQEKLRNVPMKADCVPAPDTLLPEEFRGKIDLFTVRVTCAGPTPVTGFLMIPKDAAAHSCKATVAFQGYGPGYQSELPQQVTFLFNRAEKDEIVFFINAHGYELLREKAYYDDFFAKRPAYGFSEEENADADTAYFNGMAMRVFRAYDYIKTRPEWNGKDLIAFGGSQGALQSIWAAAHVAGITLCEESITWCSDMNGPNAGRLPGWHPQYSAGIAYYDTVFHTRHIPASCRLEITRAGLGDYCCPPSGVAAQYNAANCPKKIVWYQNSTHLFVPYQPQTFTLEAPAGKGITGTYRPHLTA